MPGFKGHFGGWMTCALLLASAIAQGAPPTTRAVRFGPTQAPKPAGRSIPGISAQYQAETRIKQIYATDYADTSFDGRRALAKRLIDASELTQSDWDAKYVLLREARSIAAGIGDVTTAFDAIDRLAAAFPIVKLDTRVDALKSAMPTLSNANANLAGASICMDLVDQSVVEGEYEHAEALLGLASEAARRAKSKVYFTWIESRAEAIRPLKDAWDVARPAQLALKRAPDDPAANLVAGKFVTFVKGDFDTGLPMLAKTGGDQLAPVAKQDLATPDDRPSLQLRTANAWWDLCESLPVDYRPAIRRRAGYWYRRAQNQLDGLDRAMAQRRLQELNPPRKRSERVHRPPDALMLQPNRWYRASVAEVTWDTAQELCQSLGGQVVSVETRAEGELMAKLARGRTLWLGAVFDETNGWSWLSGGGLFYANWSSGQPLKPTSESHPQMTENGAWKIGAGKAGFICEWAE